VEHLARLPLTTKEELRDAYPFGWTCVPLQGVVRVHASSGTTGRRIVATYTAQDLEDWADMFARCFEYAGVTRADRVQITPGYGLWTAGIGFQAGVEKLGAMAVRKLTERLALRIGVFGSERWGPAMRRRIESLLGIETFDIYGLTELYGPGTGIDCHEHEGIHYWDDYYVVEVIDPATGATLPAGEEGELVITTLRKQAQPLLRYRTHDLSRLLPEPCACGSPYPRIARITGRSDDMFKVRGAGLPGPDRCRAVGVRGTVERVPGGADARWRARALPGPSRVRG